VIFLTIFPLLEQGGLKKLPSQDIVRHGEKAKGDSYIWHIRVSEVSPFNGMP
jgi:hypothetical protein